MHLFTSCKLPLISTLINAVDWMKGSCIENERLGKWGKMNVNRISSFYLVIIRWVIGTNTCLSPQVNNQRNNFSEKRAEFVHVKFYYKYLISLFKMKWISSS